MPPRRKATMALQMRERNMGTLERCEQPRPDHHDHGHDGVAEPATPKRRTLDALDVLVPLVIVHWSYS
jgi:hypothetical protein